MLRCLNIFRVGVGCMLAMVLNVAAQNPLPMVAVHDSEYTRALANMNASGATPTGSGTTGRQWWPTNWNYFVMPESVKEMLRSDGTAFRVVGDSNILAGDLLVNGQPRYPIVISLASEAIRDDEIARFTNYVAAGGYLLVGSSSFTRNTNGTARGNFAFANEMGVNMVTSSHNNWGLNNYFEKNLAHRLVNHIPGGGLVWDMPPSAEENSWGFSPSHLYQASHWNWQVQASTATIVSYGDLYPNILIKPYGKGYFIYHAAFQPLVGHGGWAPGMYAYGVFRNAIEWAFESAQTPVAKLSPWPYQYDAAYIVRHDLENYQNLIEDIEPSAAFEASWGAKGDYYFCTGTLREDMPNRAAVVTSIRNAATTYGATIGPHNGGLRNPRNTSLTHADYDYWHWGPDEALDVTPAGYSSGKAYAFASLSNSFVDIEGWMSGINQGPRNWCVPYFNGTRDDSYDIQRALNIKITGEQKLSPFPHWTLSNKTNRFYPLLNIPVGDWYVGNQIAQSMGEHNVTTLREAMDYYYNLGTLINIYSHALSDFGLPSEYITYAADTNRFPKLWRTNSRGIYDWWLQRSNVNISATHTTNGSLSTVQFTISGNTHSNTAVEIVIPGPSYTGLQILTNGVVAPASIYRTNGNLIRLRIGANVSSATINYTPCTLGAPTQISSQNFDGATVPNLPSGWTTSASGAQSAWVNQNTVRDTLPNALFASEAGAAGVSELTSPSIGIPAGQTQVTFRHNYDTEAGWDGGVLELRIGGGSFTDVLAAGGTFVQGGYTDTLSSGSGNSLSGRQAWSGNSGGFITTTVELPASAAGQNIQLRWRCATDNNQGGNGWRLDTFAINNRTYNCVPATPNTAPPILPAQSAKNVTEHATLTVTNTATDADSPAASLSYTLLVAPPEAQISTSGVITWTPDETDGGNGYTFTTRVTDNGAPPLSATNTFTVNVSENNSAPVLPTQNNRTIAETATLTVTNTATDTDIPGQNLTYSLLVAPGTAQISASGIITWSPTEANGPGVFTFTTRVVDNGSPNLSDTNTFTVTLQEVNQAPVLPAQSTKIVVESTTLTVTNTATDNDVPANVLSYQLLTPPAGAAINSQGVITWTPTLAQSPSTNLLRTVVTDNGTPALSATNQFTVIVTGDPRPNTALSLATLIDETCFPANNAVDNAETVTFNFAFINNGLANTTNLVVTLLATNGVQLPSGPQNYGVVVAAGSAVSRAFSFTAAGMCGTNITATFQMQDGSLNLGLATISFPLGSLGTVVTQNFDSVTAPALPAGWTAQSGGQGIVNWFTTNTTADTGLNSVFSADPNGPAINTPASNILTSPLIALPAGTNQLTFRHRYIMETGFDGGVLEIKIGAGPWQDILVAGGSFVSGGYNDTIENGYGSVLSGRAAWSGNVNPYVTVLVNLPPAASGQNVQLRWLFASDNGGPNGTYGWRIDSIGINGLVCCQNNPPILASQNNRTVNEGALLTVTNTVLDPGMPANPVTYSLFVTNSETGVRVTNATISAAGVITWTPTELQGPSTNEFTTVVLNSGVSALGATNVFTVVVNEINSAPTLPILSPVTVPEGTSLNVTNTASDSDLPANTLSYQLIGAPAYVSINGVGVITLSPLEVHGPVTNTFATVVSDGVASATNQLTVIVTEVNNAPTLPVLSLVTLAEGASLNVINTASDSDLPANVLSYQLIGAPAYANINAAGVISLNPLEAHGPATNTFTTVVSDGVASATNQLTVIVTEVNSAPTLPVLSPVTLAEGASLNVTNAASDSDVPANVLTYQLLGAPTYAGVNGAGVISLNPVEADGPATNTFAIVVNDGVASATNQLTVVVTEVNNAPTLPVLSPVTVAEGASLNVTNTASDSDVPANVLSYQLLGAPAYASINSAGVISLNPLGADGPATNSFAIVVSDGVASATNQLTVIVTEVNSAPTLPVLNPVTLAEGASLNVTNTASDSDVPANILSYQLIGAPGYVSINAQGIITLSPAEADGPATNTFATVVSDGTASATNQLTVIVTEVNVAPILPVQPDVVITELTSLLITNTASDLDLPANGLTYSLGIPENHPNFLLSNPPTGATIDAQGVIRWTPSEEQGPSTNVFITIVADNGTPQMFATNSFTVVVLEANVAPVLPLLSPIVMAENTSMAVTNAATDADWPRNALAYQLIGAPAFASVNATNGIITLNPSENDGPSTNAFAITVSDGLVSVTNPVTAVVNEVNAAPVLPPLAPIVIAENVSVLVTNTATDADLPQNALVYQLLGAPAFASINANGIMMLSPAENDGPSTNVFAIIVSDGLVSVTNPVTVVVNEVNAAPVLPLLDPIVVMENVSVLVTNTATDADLPQNTLVYQLLGAPAFASINPANGVITLSPSESDGPNTNAFAVTVSDGLVTVTNSVTVIVNEANSAPTLGVVADRSIRNFKTLSVSNPATDSDVPVQTINYSLLTAPPSAAIDAAGTISWTANVAHCPHTNLFVTVATDSLGASTTNTFAVVVTEPVAPLIESILPLSNRVRVQWSSVAGESYQVQARVSYDAGAQWTNVSPAIVAGEAATSFEDESVVPGSVGQRFYRVVLLP